MSFWMELRCDIGHIGCLSHKNQGPMSRFTNVIAGAKVLASDGEKAGWSIINGQAMCPRCRGSIDNASAA